MTDQTETPDLAELRRLLDAATPRPWAAGDDITGAWVNAGWAHGNTDMLRSVVDWMPHREDARLIAAAVNALPALLDAAAERVALGRRGDTLARDLGAAVVRADRAESERDALAAKVERLTAGRDDTPRDDSAWATPGQAWATYAELRAERDALELYLSRVEMALRVAADARDEAEAAVERVRVLAERWRTHAGTGSLAADVFGRQTVTVDTAVAEIVRAIGRADS